MPEILRSGDLEVEIDLPKECYRHSRFDWTGQIRSVRYRGIEFCGSELEIQDKQQDELYGRGLCNEFGMDAALGYGESEYGQEFQKIGVGYLRRDDERYQFIKLYDVRSAAFSIETQTESLLVQSCQSHHNGFGYALRKSIQLHNSGFEIEYHLKNTGGEIFRTDEYNHNFLFVDKTRISKDYRLLFDFDIKPEEFRETVNPDEAVDLKSRSLTFNKIPPDCYFFSNMSGGKEVSAGWRLENTGTGLAISESGDFTSSKINLWGCGHVICPEIFVKIELESGESMDWKRQYRIYEL